MEKELTTLFTGRNIIRLDAVDSTNSYLAERARQDQLSEGTLVIAEEQLAGRGQSGTNWASEKGKNLLCSYLFYPAFLNSSDMFLLSKCYSLATATALEELTGELIRIKWPNDIYYRYKKLGGILIENSITGGKIGYSIFGLGLNINQEEFPENLTNPVSLKLISGKEFLQEEVVNRISNHLEACYLQLKAGRVHEITEAYLKRLYLFNQWSLYKDSDGRFTGRIIAIERSGKILIEKENGTLKSYEIKELSFGHK